MQIQNTASYSQDELISSTEVVRNFGDVMDNLSSKKRNKYAILRKNKLEVVMLGVAEYENLQAIKNFMEDFGLYQELQERLKTKKSEYIDFEEVLKDNKISLKDL